MKRFVVAGALLLMCPWQLEAAPAYGRAGCGLGSVMMGPTGNQISAWTSNVSSYNQAFGITSGTSNCVPEKKLAALLEQEHFIQANLSTISKEMAQGNGTTLKAYASVLGCPREVFTDFAQQMQGSYKAIFGSPGALAVLEATKEEAKDHPVLAAQCTQLI